MNIPGNQLAVEIALCYRTYCELQSKCHFAIEIHTFQGCFLYSLCIFNRKFRNKLAFLLQLQYPG